MEPIMCSYLVCTRYFRKSLGYILLTLLGNKKFAKGDFSLCKEI